MVVDDLPERRPHRQLVGPRTDDVAGDAEELRAGALLGTDRAEPVGTPQHDVRHAGERLDVVDDRRAAEEAMRRGKWRLDARVAALALERFDEAGLLPADVGPGPAMHPHVEVESGAEDVLAEEARLPRLRDRRLEPLGAERELAADVDVRRVTADRVGGDDDAFEQLVRVLLDDEAILERAGLALVGVDREVDGLRRLLRQEAPFEPCRKPRAAAATQVRRLHDPDQLLGRARRERLARGLVPAVRHVDVQPPEVRDVPAAQQQALGHPWRPSPAQRPAAWGCSGSGPRRCFCPWIFRCSAMRPSSTTSGRGGQPGT